MYKLHCNCVVFVTRTLWHRKNCWAVELHRHRQNGHGSHQSWTWCSHNAPLASHTCIHIILHERNFEVVHISRTFSLSLTHNLDSQICYYNFKEPNLVVQLCESHEHSIKCQVFLLFFFLWHHVTIFFTGCLFFFFLFSVPRFFGANKYRYKGLLFSIRPCIFEPCDASKFCELKFDETASSDSKKMSRDEI